MISTAELWCSKPTAEPLAELRCSKPTAELPTLDYGARSLPLTTYAELQCSKLTSEPIPGVVVAQPTVLRAMDKCMETNQPSSRTA